jgi:tetratricopeptide (TPR) repeat protein
MCSIRCSALWLLLALGLLLGQTAHADPLLSARGHLARGLELYRAGDYAEAVREFEAGHAALPHPNFLLNLAQAWRKLGDLERARAYYAQFISVTPAGDGARLQAEAAIDKIDAELRARPLAPVATPPAVAAPPVGVVTPPAATPTVVVTRSRSPRLGWVGLGLGAVGVASVAAAAGLVATAVQLDDQYVHPPLGTVYDPRLADRRDLDRNLAVGLFAAGGVLITVGTVLAVRFWPRRAAAPRAPGAPPGRAPALEAAF